MNRWKILGAGMLLLSGLVFAGEPLDQLRFLSNLLQTLSRAGDS